MKFWDRLVAKTLGIIKISVFSAEDTLGWLGNPGLSAVDPKVCILRSSRFYEYFETRGYWGAVPYYHDLERHV